MQSLDETIVIGGFIISTNPTGILKKFKREFEWCFKSIKITTKDLIILSKWDEN